MITEDYVSFEVAKLLKEKGFKEWCRCCYGVAVLHNGEDISFDEECELKDEGRENEIEYVEGGTFYYFNCNNGDEDTNVWAAPTLQMAMKWLREVHGLFIFISTWLKYKDGTIQYYYEMRNLNDDDFETLYDYTSKEINSYEKACEEAIRYCLENLI